MPDLQTHALSLAAALHSIDMLEVEPAVALSRYEFQKWEVQCSKSSDGVIGHRALAEPQLVVQHINLSLCVLVAA